MENDKKYGREQGRVLGNGLARLGTCCSGRLHPCGNNEMVVDFVCFSSLGHFCVLD